MNDSKVYYMSEDVEHQYLTEDSKTRIYLSPVFGERPRKRKETILEKIVSTILALCYSMLITYIIGQWIIDYVEKQRGYKAIGGEHIFTIVIFIVNFWLMRKLLKCCRRA